MCGILGGINTGFDESSLECLRHRGPDQQSLARERSDGNEVVLGQTRLNVVDRNDVELPIRLNGATIVFNGEIYNHVELRQELEGLGWTFKTKTDIEVALAAYLQWKEGCLERFNGMWALVVWDGERFFCARDRMGQKPLFYRVGSDRFEFASEIKAFSGLEFVGHEIFDLFEFCLNEHTLYRDVLSVRPGHYLVYDARRGSCATRPYWNIEHQSHGMIRDEDEAVEQFTELLRDSVRLRMRADVPVTMFLSGGVDSALLAVLSGVEKAYTCQFKEFEDSINEETYARDLAGRLGIELEVIHPTRDEFLSDLPDLARYLEMPTGSFSVFPLYRLSRACREGGFKVVLSGEGSDEIFAGYARNEFLLSESLSARDEKQENYASMFRRYHGSELNRFCRMASRSGLAGAAQMTTFFSEHWSARESMLRNLSYIESRFFLQPLLQMGDRMTMAVGVEGRCPFLDYRLIEFAFSLEDSLRFRDGVGKWIVHQAARRLLPENALVLERKVKHGLPTPVNLWMQGRHSFDRKYWNTIMMAECVKLFGGGATG